MCTWVLSCVQLFVTPWTITFRAPLSLEYSRQEYWNGLPFPTPGTMKTWTPNHMPIKLLLKVFLLIFLSIYTQCTLIIFILQLITFYKSLNSGFIYNKSHTDKSCFTKMHLFKSTLKYILIDKCHQLIYTESESEVAKSCPILCDPMDYSLPGSSVHGILQASILEWVAVSFSRRSSQPRDQTRVSRIAGRHFTIWATWEALFT